MCTLIRRGARAHRLATRSTAATVASAGVRVAGIVDARPRSLWILEKPRRTARAVFARVTRLAHADSYARAVGTTSMRPTVRFATSRFRNIIMPAANSCIAILPCIDAHLTRIGPRSGRRRRTSADPNEGRKRKTREAHRSSERQRARLHKISLAAYSDAQCCLSAALDGGSPSKAIESL